MRAFEDVWYSSQDGLSLYSRFYVGEAQAATLVCIPGLTRNSADFAHLVDALDPALNLYLVDLRGRGRSQYDPNPLNYHPGTYVQDILTLLNARQIVQPLVVGTSLGGLVAMLMAAMQPGLLQGMVLNDIGPEVPLAGMQRIRSYLLTPHPVENWDQAVQRIRAVHGDEFPDLTDNDWHDFARNLYRQDEQGVPVLNYDPGITELVKLSDPNQPPADIWPAFEAIQGTPMLILRGEYSDILTAQTAKRMCQMKPDARCVEVPRVGHAPLLTEPDALRAIREFLG